MIKKTLVFLAIVVGVTVHQRAHAASEAVGVLKVLDDSGSKVVIIRRTGERYIVEYGVGCLSMWRYEGKAIIINSPGLFGGIGSNLILPNEQQTCRVWNLDTI